MSSPSDSRHFIPVRDEFKSHISLGGRRQSPNNGEARVGWQHPRGNDSARSLSRARTSRSPMRPPASPQTFLVPPESHGHQSKGHSPFHRKHRDSPDVAESLLQSPALCRRQPLQACVCSAILHCSGGLPPQCRPGRGAAVGQTPQYVLVGTRLWRESWSEQMSAPPPFANRRDVQCRRLTDR
jgi:hypothetical protein